jgi:hypothetical protein
MREAEVSLRGANAAGAGGEHHQTDTRTSDQEILERERAIRQAELGIPRRRTDDPRMTGVNAGSEG